MKMKKEIEELIGALNILDKIDTPYADENVSPEELRKNLRYGFGNLKIDLPIQLDDVLNVKMGELDKGDPIFDSVIWATRFMMLYFNTDIVLETDELAEVYRCCNYDRDIKNAERFISNVTDVSTSKRGNLIYTALKTQNFWYEVQDMSKFNQLILLRLIDEFTILAGITKEGIIIRSRTGKMKLSYKQLEESLTDIISIYSTKL